MKIKTIFLLMLLLPFLSKGQEMEEFKREKFVHQGDTLNYRVLYPENFSKKEQYPVVLFLHGAGERGDNNESQLTHGGRLFLEKRTDFPAIVIFPQAPAEDYWAQVAVDRDTLPLELDFRYKEGPTTSLKLVMDLMDSISSEKYVDNQRIYLGGLSMGGMGTFELLSRRPAMFSAAIAICGAADPEIATNYPKDLDIWIFHGEKDNVVAPEHSKHMARVINSNGGNAKLSLYPEANHNSWDPAFAEPQLLPWLFSHSKNKK